MIPISRVGNFISYVSRVALYYITKRRYILDFKSELSIYLSEDKGYSSNARWNVDSSVLWVEHNIETWLVVRRDVIGHGITRRRYRRSLRLDTQYRWHMRNWSPRLTILLPWNRILESHEWQNNQILTNKRSCQLYERAINISEYRCLNERLYFYLILNAERLKFCTRAYETLQRSVFSGIHKEFIRT